MFVHETATHQMTEKFKLLHVPLRNVWISQDVCHVIYHTVVIYNFWPQLILQFNISLSKDQKENSITPKMGIF